MVYKCNNCKYSTKRRVDLIRHENKKGSCINNQDILLSGLQNNNILEKVGGRVNNPLEKVGVVGNNLLNPLEKVGVDNDGVVHGSNLINYSEIVLPKYICNKCNKEFTTKHSLEVHQIKCDGLDKFQCKTCLKKFNSKYGKYEHKKSVKCTPPISIVNNKDSYNNTINNNINNNININIGFGKERVNQLTKEDWYFDFIEKIIDSGDLCIYGIIDCVRLIFFNPDYPENQTIIKESKKGNIVKVLTSPNNYDNRILDHTWKQVLSIIERFFNTWFDQVSIKLKKEQDRNVVNKNMAKIRRFGNRMLWYGWECEKITKLGIFLNYPCTDTIKAEALKTKKIKGFNKILSLKIYEETLKLKEYYKLNEKLLKSITQI
jgi:hypothetical protein